MNNEPVRILSLEELCEQLTIGRNAAYNLLRTGQIKAFRIKRIWKSPQSSINEYVQTGTKYRSPLGLMAKGRIITHNIFLLGF